MSYVGKWAFHSIGAMNENGETFFMNAEAYLHSPMPYINESDPEAVADELNERKQLIGGKIAVCEDGKLYLLLPVPEGVSQEEVDAAVKEGEIQLFDGMLTDGPRAWEVRDGALWLEVGEDMSDDGWEKISDDNGHLVLMTIVYERAE